MKDSARQRTNTDAILDAADRLLAECGYKRMTIEKLASEAGIGKGSVYLHFKCKEDIALSHIDRIIERLKASLREIAANGDVCEERLSAMLVKRVLFRFDSVQHYTRSLNEILSQVRPRLLERRRRYFNEEARIFAGVIEEGIGSGRFRSQNPGESAATLLDATNALLPYSLSAFELGGREEIADRATRVADLLLKGLVRK